jgi:hypothetical protein
LYRRIQDAVKTLAISVSGDEEVVVAENISCAYFERLYEGILRKFAGRGDRIKGFHLKLLSGALVASLD